MSEKLETFIKRVRNQPGRGRSGVKFAVFPNKRFIGYDQSKRTYFPDGHYRYVDTICYVNLQSLYSSVVKAHGISRDVLLSGKFVGGNPRLSTEELTRYLKLLKDNGHIPRRFGAKRFIKSKEYIFRLDNYNLQHLYYYLCMLRYVTEAPQLVRSMFYLVDKGIDFTLAHVISVLEVTHNYWHGPYSKSVPNKWGLRTVPGTTMFGMIETVQKCSWRPNEKYVVQKLRIGKEADINKIIRMAIKTKKFLASKRPLISKTGIYMPYKLCDTIWEQPVEDDEWQFGFDYGEYDKLINFNPFERMKEVTNE